MENKPITYAGQRDTVLRALDWRLWEDTRKGRLKVDHNYIQEVIADTKNIIISRGYFQPDNSLSQCDHLIDNASQSSRASAINATVQEVIRGIKRHFPSAESLVNEYLSDTKVKA